MTFDVLNLGATSNNPLAVFLRQLLYVAHGSSTILF
jgi:hypothetical protein